MKRLKPDHKLMMSPLHLSTDSFITFNALTLARLLALLVIAPYLHAGTLRVAENEGRIDIFNDIRATIMYFRSGRGDISVTLKSLQ